MSSPQTLTLGAVAYDPKVVTIWDGFQRYFARNGLPFDYVLYSNYERQVESHFAGDFHVAWNSPLAWLQAQRIAKAVGRRAEAIGMRDTDQDLTSVIAVRSESTLRDVTDLQGKRVAVGAYDSPQATLIPLDFIANQGLSPGSDFEVLYYDKLPGKHGDHIGGERDAASALLRGEADAACMIDGNLLGFGRDGTLPAGSVRVLTQTPAYDHCNFTVLDGAPEGLIARFRELLLSMSYADSGVRPLLDLEGLKQWQPGRTTGYAALNRALDRFGTVDAMVSGVAAACKK
jgi:phosphonate transport system substrate-binding protein